MASPPTARRSSTASPAASNSPTPTTAAKSRCRNTWTSAPAWSPPPTPTRTARSPRKNSSPPRGAGRRNRLGTITHHRSHEHPLAYCSLFRHGRAWSDDVGIAVPVLQLNAADFDDNMVCLGPQVASVLEALIALPELSKAAWYAASVDAIGSPEVRVAFRSYEPREPRSISDMATFVLLAERAVQFLDGVFFAVPVGQPPMLLPNLSAPMGRSRGLWPTRSSKCARRIRP